MPRKLLILFSVLLVAVSCGTDDGNPVSFHGGFASISDARSAVVTVPDAELAQYGAWAVELGVWAASPVRRASVTAPVLDQALGELEFFQWVITNAGAIPTTTPSNQALEAAVWVAESYNRAPDSIVVNDDGSVYFMSNIQANLSEVLDSLGVVVGGEKLAFVGGVGSMPCNPSVQNCTQYALPDGNSSTTNYTQGVAAGDGDADWFDELDEGIDFAAPDDGTTRWTSPSNPVNECIATTLGTVTDPRSDVGHYIKTRDSYAGGKTVNLGIELLEGAAVRATGSFFGISGSFTTRSYNLTTGETDSITDYSNLIARTCVNAVGGGSPTETNITAQEFETPDPTRRRISVTTG